jgi:hypothetical protein
MKKLEQNLAQLRVRREQLTAKRVKDAAELETARAVQQELLLKGDLDDANTAERLHGRFDSATDAWRCRSCDAFRPLSWAFCWFLCFFGCLPQSFRSEH